jgi:hypothetical protein
MSALQHPTSSSPHQAAIDEGKAALARLPSQIADLVITIARDMAPEGEDWREYVAPACRQLTADTRAALARMGIERRRQIGLRVMIYRLRELAR